MKKTRRKRWLEHDYNSFKRRKQGKKLISIFRILARNLSTIREIENLTDYSRSEIRNLLFLAEKHQHVHKISGGPVRRPRGRHTVSKGFEKETGRPPLHYILTSKGLFLMRFDPELADDWKSIAATYNFHQRHMLDSYNNLKYAIQKHPELGKLEKPYYFDGELQRKLLNPFLFERGLNEEQVSKLSDEIIRLIKENVRPEHIRNYVSTLQNSVSRLENVIKRHRMLIEKIKSTEASLEAPR